MKYLKGIFESKKINDTTKKILSDFGVTEKELSDMVKLLGEQEYSPVKERVPFLLSMIEDDDYNIDSYENMRKLINAYEYFNQRVSRIQEVEDYLLDLTEDPLSGIKIEVSKAGSVIIIAEFENLSDISNKINEIEKRLKRSDTKYEIESFRDTKDTETNKKVFYLRIYIIQASEIIK